MFMLTAHMNVLTAHYALCCVSYKMSAYICFYILGLCLFTFLHLHKQPHILVHCH